MNKGSWTEVFVVLGFLGFVFACVTTILGVFGVKVL